MAKTFARSFDMGVTIEGVAGDYFRATGSVLGRPEEGGISYWWWKNPPADYNHKTTIDQTFRLGDEVMVYYRGINRRVKGNIFLIGEKICRVRFTTPTGLIKQTELTHLELFRYNVKKSG